jgi:hypothetical protein
MDQVVKEPSVIIGSMAGNVDILSQAKIHKCIEM